MPMWNVRLMAGIAAVMAAGAAAAAGQDRALERSSGPSCELELYLVLDASGSMDDRDNVCAAELRRKHDDPNYNVRKPCWSMLNDYGKEAHEVVRQVCRSANQPDPRVSITVFRCPGTGQDRKVILEPNNDPVAIEDSFGILLNQQITGYSCAFGALAQVRDWIKISDEEFQAKAQTDAVSDYGPKRPVVVMLTDGLLGNNDRVKSEQLTARLRDKFGSMIVAATAFPTNGMKNALEKHTAEDLVLDASDPNSLQGVSFAIGDFITSLGDFKSCTVRQRACLEARASLLDVSATSCGTVQDMFTGLASCLGAGCNGADLTAHKNMCVAESNKRLDALADADQAQGSAAAACTLRCDDIETHLNAQNYGLDPTGAGYADSTAPGFMFNGRRFPEVALDETSFGPAWAVPGALPGAAQSGAPVLGDGGKIIATSTSANGSRAVVFCADARTGEINWEFVLPAAGVAVVAQPVLGPRTSDNLFFGDSLGTFYQLSAADGTLKRSWSLGGAVRAAAAVPADSDYVMVAVAAMPGITPAFLYKLYAGSQALSEPTRAWKRAVCRDDDSADRVVQGLALLDSQAVVLACRSGFVERYALVNGQRLWRLETAGHVHAMPAIEQANRSLYVTSERETANALVKFDLAGEQVWAVPLQGHAHGGPAVSMDGEDVFVAMSNGVVARYNASTGQLAASASFSAEERPRRFRIAQDATGALVLADGDVVHILDPASLEVLASAQAASPITSSPVLADGAVFFSTIASALVRFDSDAVAAIAGGRLLEHTTNTTWPPAAIALTVVLALLLLVMLLVLRCVLRARQ